MASLMDNLLTVLETECNVYDELLTVTQQKTKAIVEANLDELEKITDEEQDFVSKLANLEKQREAAMKDIANVLNRDVKTLKLADLVNMLSMRPAESSKLAELHDRLKNSVNTLRKINAQNGALLENSLEMVNFELNLIQSLKSAPQTANYNKGAYTSGTVMGSARGKFDAKQ